MKFSKMFRKIVNPLTIFPIPIFILVLILSLLKISGSSVGIYSYIFGTQNSDKDLIFGTPRSIRSDEWLVHTPFVVSQYYNNFESLNNSIGLGQNMSISGDAPTKHWSTIFRPPNWAFFIMPLENAFAFKWWIRGFLIITGTYLVTLIITKNNILLSVASSLILFFSPFVQWWYSIYALDVIPYFFFILYFLLRVFHYTNKLGLVFNSLFLVYFSVCFVLVLYPPFQIPLVLLIIFFFTGYVLNNWDNPDKERLKTFILAGSLIMSIIIFILTFFYISFKEIIEIIQNTSYPGKRVTEGGNYPLVHFLNGFYNIFLLKDAQNIPKVFGNQSEASNFIILFPFVLPMVFVQVFKDYLRKKNIDFLLLFLTLYILLVLAWIFAGLPSFISKILLLDLVPPNRNIIGIGIANLIFIVYFLNKFKISLKKTQYLALGILSSSLAFLTYLYEGTQLSKLNPLFIQNPLAIILIALLAFLVVILLYLKKQKLFVFSLLSFTILISLAINPLYKGLQPLINSDFLSEIKEIDDKSEGRWVVYNSIIYGDYLSANGIKSLNGTHLYPQLKIWRLLDSSGNFDFIYNRYAHIIFEDTEEKVATFSLVQPDTFIVKINPCNNFFKEVDVKYFLFEREVQYPCLNLARRTTNLKGSSFAYKRQN